MNMHIYQDGKASERIVNEIVKVIENKAIN